MRYIPPLNQHTNALFSGCLQNASLETPNQKYLRFAICEEIQEDCGFVLVDCRAPRLQNPTSGFRILILVDCGILLVDSGWLLVVSGFLPEDSGFLEVNFAGFLFLGFLHTGRYFRQPYSFRQPYIQRSFKAALIKDTCSATS